MVDETQKNQAENKVLSGKVVLGIETKRLIVFTLTLFLLKQRKPFAQTKKDKGETREVEVNNHAIAFRSKKRRSAANGINTQRKQHKSKHDPRFDHPVAHTCLSLSTTSYFLKSKRQPKSGKEECKGYCPTQLGPRRFARLPR
jgi:hypothetical protein